jgi:hypothetical protein
MSAFGSKFANLLSILMNKCGFMEQAISLQMLEGTLDCFLEFLVTLYTKLATILL